MDYLVMIENAMNMHNLSLLLMPESYQGGGKAISKLQSTTQYFSLRQYDTIVLSFCCVFLGK